MPLAFPYKGSGQWADRLEFGGTVCAAAKFCALAGSLYDLGSNTGAVACGRVAKEMMPAEFRPLND